MKTFKFLFCAIIIALFSSCSITRETFTYREPSKKIAGNKYDDFKGATENQILRTMSSPDRQMSDGAGGKILIYEDVKFVTNSTNTHSSYTSSSAYGSSTAGYNYNGNPQVNSNAYGSSSTTQRNNTQTVSEEQKNFVNFFINSEGVCYDVNANCGYIYERIPGQYRDCNVRDMSEWGFLLWLNPPFGLVYTICYFIMDGKVIENSCGEIYEK